MLLNFFSFNQIPDEDADDEFRDEVQHSATIWQLDLLKVLISLCFWQKLVSCRGSLLATRSENASVVNAEGRCTRISLWRYVLRFSHRTLFLAQRSLFKLLIGKVFRNWNGYFSSGGPLRATQKRRHKTPLFNLRHMVSQYRVENSAFAI